MMSAENVDKLCSKFSLDWEKVITMRSEFASLVKFSIIQFEQ